MIQSTLTTLGRQERDQLPETGDGRDSFHVAIIMDGNGRWAQERRRPRSVGHVAGTRAVRRTVEAAPGLGITTLTLYAFSSDNWRRPREEVGHLMRLFQRHLDAECAHLRASGVRLTVIGRRDRIPDVLRHRIEHVEADTRDGAALHLRLAVDYSSRDALLAAAVRLAEGGPATRPDLERHLADVIHAPPGTRAVDLLIRTGGEQRLSDFLLWESAYAELLFTDVLWPDFGEADLARCIQTFHRRDRRFGGLSQDPGRAAPSPSREEGVVP